jgi:DNA polymerase-3 subunit epsilon
VREIILDTETTGLDPAKGDRIVEIGAVELFNHVATGNTFHVYINPERAMPAEAQAVHGLTDAFLRDKPVFAAVADDFLAFIGDAPLIIHNASFDMAFLNAELGYLGKPQIDAGRVVDTLAIARRKFPMAPVSLDALCKRFGIDASHRSKHGALLDSELLSLVYLELVGGRQISLTLATSVRIETQGEAVEIRAASRPVPLPPRLTAEEILLHLELVESLGENSLWLAKQPAG